MKRIDSFFSIKSDDTRPNKPIVFPPTTDEDTQPNARIVFPPVRDEDTRPNKVIQGQQLSRRELLTPWKRQGYVVSAPPPLPEVEPEIAKFTRKQFLKFLAVTGSFAIAGHYLGNRIDSTLQKNTTTNKSALLQQGHSSQEKDMPLQSGQQQFESNDLEADVASLSDTATQTLLYTLSEFVSAPIVRALRIPIGNSGISEKVLREFMEKPLYKLLLDVGVETPLLEEAIFRALPQLLVKNKTREDLWNVGIPTSVLFALVHNMKHDEEGNEIVFATDRIPLYQFISGLFLWKLMRERGLPHSILAHGVNNSAALSVARLYYNVFSDKKLGQSVAETTDNGDVDLNM